MTHPGVAPVTALATEVFLGDPKRFADGKSFAGYIGMIPSEHSSAAGAGSDSKRRARKATPPLFFISGAKWQRMQSHEIRSSNSSLYAN